MSSIIIPISVALIGKYLNDKKESREITNIRNKLPDNELVDSLGPYNNNRYNESIVKEMNEGKKMWDKSLNPKETNVIPNNFNQFYTNTGEPRLLNNETILPQHEFITKTQMDMEKNKIIDGPMFGVNNKENFDENVDPVRIRKTSNDPNTNRGMSLNSTGEISSLTGLPLDPTHNNMVPNFGSNVTQNTDPDINEGILDRHTGVGKIPNRKKKETLPFFNLQKDNIFGTQPLPEELRKDRFVQSNLKTNVLPTPQVRVLPIDQAESRIRPYMKNIDELRYKSNPKISFKSRPLAPPKGTDQRGIFGEYNKNQPTKTFYIGDKYRIAQPNPQTTAPRMPEDHISAWKYKIMDGTENPNYKGIANSSYKATKPRLKKKKRNKFN